MYQINADPGKTLWHVAVDVAYEGGDTDSCQDGIQRVLSTLEPLTRNGSGIKQVLILKLPDKNW
jgi:hypothetical protein